MERGYRTPPPKYSVIIPPPGNFSQRNPNPTALSAAPTFTGWGVPRVTMTTRVIEKKPLVVSAAGFAALIECEYKARASVDPTVWEKIPFSVFQYFMVCIWWRKALLETSRSRVLDPEEREALTSLQSIGDVYIPSRIKSYFESMGSFTSDCVRWQYDVGKFDISGWSKSLGFNGFLKVHDSLQMNRDSMRDYGHVFIPGVVWSRVLRDSIFSSEESISVGDYFRDIRPQKKEFPGCERVEDTGAILGWSPKIVRSGRTSFLRFMRQSGVSKPTPALPLMHDQVTAWLVSPWMLHFASRALSSWGTCELWGVQWNEGSVLQLTRTDVNTGQLYSQSGGYLRGKHPLLVLPSILGGSQKLPDDWIQPAIGFSFGYDPTDICGCSPWVGIKSGLLAWLPPAAAVGSDSPTREPFFSLPASVDYRASWPSLNSLHLYKEFETTYRTEEVVIGDLFPQLFLE